MGSNKRLYILDTNVLMHDPTAIFRFEEHDVFLPMMVLEELDAAKKGLSEVSRNVRQVSRFIGEMMQRQHATRLDEGLLLQEPDGLELAVGTGRLYFQTAMPEALRVLVVIERRGVDPDLDDYVCAGRVEAQARAAGTPQ